LLDQLDYDPNTGIFRWKHTRHRVNAGDVAGSITSKGYRTIKIDGEAHKAHRLAWFYMAGVWPTGVIDHRNGKTDDNRFANLRDTNQTSNTENQQNLSRRSTTGFKGVTFVSHLGKYKAQISSKGVHTYLGLHETPEAAHDAYMTAKRKLHQGFVEPKSTA
jgi:hypothetical protein